MSVRTNQDLEALRAVDSPTLSNAIERCLVRPRTEGYRRLPAALRLPRARLDAGLCRDLHRRQHDRSAPATDDGLLRLWAAIERAPKPAVLVIHDVGPGSDARLSHGRGHGDDREGARRGRLRLRRRPARCRRGARDGRLPVPSAPASSCRTAAP